MHWWEIQEEIESLKLKIARDMLVLGEAKVFVTMEKNKVGSIFTSKLRMELAELKQKHQLELEVKQAAFDRAMKNWTEDKERLESKLKQENEIKLTEAVTLTKLESQQRTAQLELDYNRKIEDLKTKNAVALAEYKTKLAEEYHEKLSVALNKLHTEGNVTTKFTQELALKMLEKAPPQTNRIELMKGKLKDI